MDDDITEGGQLKILYMNSVLEVSLDTEKTLINITVDFIEFIMSIDEWHWGCSLNFLRMNNITQDVIIAALLGS